MTILLVLRPEPGAAATVAAARAQGLEAVALPLFAVRRLPWEPPAPAPDAVLMTSANAARHGGDALAAFGHLPLYAVGPATAAAARAAGFARIVTGDDDGAAIVARAAGDGVTRLLHLAGREHQAFAADGIVVERRIVYAADAIDPPPPFPPGGVALLHSPRAAARFAAIVPSRAAFDIVAISSRTRVAAGPGWRTAVIADAPTDTALLAAAGKLCDQAPGRR